MRHLSLLLIACSLLLATTWQSVFAADEIYFDFVADRPFPETGKKNREFAKELTFSKDGMVISARAENEFGGAEEVSRRGPGGLGVKGNGDRNADGEGTTSGNRINNGEHLVLQFTDEAGEAIRVKITSLVIDRVVRDSKNFPDVSATHYSVMADNQPVASGELSLNEGETKGGPYTITAISAEPVSSVQITNGQPFHPIANRFRVGAITVERVQ